ncbi:MFS transporter [Pseudomonas neustonica]|uniref:MFS transporter n=1 Tax=Pseudomonas neustonica TaxID=2487346 RepID=A0ABX9XLJ7_9PSED|nr:MULTISPECIES: MFS transporter [Pseudomonas]ROZ86028.1 MFS transporter [Pseudomonas sp. SSM44]ROZ87753.1 MFS transporter [Pseudomonas neustonica]|tara:strand:- start:3080 stop:4441 length:1362 start_codon:yes stop_codon:yes gene_type:complete
MKDLDGLPMPQRLGAIIAIALGVTMAVLDGMIANVALPTIADDLGTSAANSIWIVNAYQLVITMSLLSLASFGDLWSYRKVYLIGLGVFASMSVLCALSDSLLTLTIARMLQGLGAAAVMSVNGALTRLIYPRRILARGIAINTLIVAVSAAAGPTVAAGVLSIASWPWLFAINVPIGLLALIMGYRFLPANAGVREQRFDKLSGLLNAITFGLFFAALTGFAQGHAGWMIGLPLVLTIVVGWFFVRRQLDQPFPLLPIDLLRIPVFSLSIGTSVCSFAAQMLAMVSIPFYFQKTLGLSEIETGLLMTPWPLATMVMAPIAGRLLDRVHAGLLGGIGLAIFATGLFMLAALPQEATHLEIMLRMLLCGAGFGLFQSPNNHTILTAAPLERSGGASGMLSTARLVGQTTGAALVALSFNLFADNGTHASLIAAGSFACVAAIVSSLRMSQTPIR